MVSSHENLTAQLGGVDMPLADLTVRATGEIAGQVDEIQTVTKDTAGTIKEIGGVVGRLDGISAEIAAAVQQNGVASGSQEVSENIQAVTGAAGETGRESVQTLEVAWDLALQAERPDQEVEDFFQHVRGA